METAFHENVLTNKTVLYFSYAYNRTTWAIGIVHHDRKFTKPAFE